jgi:hypothetical protein
MQTTEKSLSTARATPVSDTLVLIAASSAPEIWRGDAAGSLVSQAVGAPRVSRVSGESVVACGRGTSPSPSPLPQARRDTHPSGTHEGRSHAAGALVPGAPSRPTRHCSGRGRQRRAAGFRR